MYCFVRALQPAAFRRTMADSEQALELEELLPSRVGGAGGVDSDSDRPLSPQEPGKRRGLLATRATVR